MTSVSEQEYVYRVAWDAGDIGHAGNTGPMSDVAARKRAEEYGEMRRFEGRHVRVERAPLGSWERVEK